MSDETKKGDAPPPEHWKMPEPVFRSSPGRSPNDPPAPTQDDIPTEPGFDEMETEENVDLSGVESDPDSSQSVRQSTKVRVRGKKKKGGCARTFLTIIGLVAVLAIGIVSALIYFLFYYRPTDTATF